MTQANHNTAEVLARVKALMAAKDAAAHGGHSPANSNSDIEKSDYFKRSSDRVAPLTGATALNIINDSKLVKEVAPTAPDTDLCQTGVTYVDGEINQPTNSHAASLRSPDEATNFANANADDDPCYDDLMDEGSAEPKAQVELGNPDFYKIRVDLFDNGQRHRATRYTAKFTCMMKPTSTKDYIVFADFYSRPRDMKAAVRDKYGMWNVWYDDLVSTFTEIQKMDGFTAEPMIAILKEQYKDANGINRAQAVGYTAAICYQLNGASPAMHMFYQDFQTEITMNSKFEDKGKNLIARGSFKDETRAHLEARTGGTMVVRGSDFFADF